MTNKIRVALLGLGDVGEIFAEHFLERIQEHNAPVEIVAVADRHADSPVVLGFSQNGVPVFQDALDVIKLGDKVDIIFDLTGNAKLRHELRQKLVATNNRHTVIATEVFARLMWIFFADGVVLPPRAGGHGGY